MVRLTASIPGGFINSFSRACRERIQCNLFKRDRFGIVAGYRSVSLASTRSRAGLVCQLEWRADAFDAAFFLQNQRNDRIGRTPDCFISISAPFV
jgi:hypothetical protein